MNWSQDGLRIDKHCKLQLKSMSREAFWAKTALATRPKGKNSKKPETCKKHHRVLRDRCMEKHSFAVIRVSAAAVYSRSKSQPPPPSNYRGNQRSSSNRSSRSRWPNSPPHRKETERSRSRARSKSRHRHESPPHIRVEHTEGSGRRVYDFLDSSRSRGK